MSVLSRRGFLGQVGAGVAAVAVGQKLARATAGHPFHGPISEQRPPGSGSPDWDVIKRSFNLDPSSIQMGGFFLASHPEPVRAAIEGHRKGLDLNPLDYVEAHGNELETQVFQAAASYLGVDPGQIALTDSTTMGLGLLYNGIQITPGQEIVSTIHDHWATQRALDLRARRFGLSVRRVTLYNPVSPEILSEEGLIAPLLSALTEKTRTVAVTWVHSNTGVKLPIRRLADRIAQLNEHRDSASRILLCVDGVHGFGVEDFSFNDLGCDFFVAGCHKWLFGPRGTGLICGRPEAWSSVAPSIASFSAFADDAPPGRINTPGGYHSFEHRWALKEAFEFHHKIGKASVTKRIRELGAAFKDGLVRIPGAKLITPVSADYSAGIVALDVPKYPMNELLKKLETRGVFAAFNYNGVPGVRVAPGLINDLGEVERTLGAIASLK